MKQLLAALILLGFNGVAMAQSTSLADSIQQLMRGTATPGSTGYNARMSSAASVSVYSNAIEKNRLQQTMSNATQLVADSIRQAGILLASYRYTKGGLHLSQEANKSQEAPLYTEGVATLGNTRIAGSFRAARLWEDSLANYLGGYFDGISPYYYFATKAGKYQGQEYNMKMVLAHGLLRNKLYLGLGADYDYAWVTRSVDPRPDDEKMRLNVHPSVSLRIGKMMAGIEYTGGYEKSTINIDYQNSTFNLSTLYPDRFYYMNMGYGNIALKYGVITKRTGSTQGIGLHLAGTAGEYDIKADAAYQQREQVNHKTLDTALKSTFFSRWRTNNYQGKLMIMRRKPGNVQQLLLDVQLTNGSDFNSLYNGRNYFAQQNKFSLAYYYQAKKSSGLQPQYSMFLNYSEGYKKDVLAAHYLQYSTIQPGLSAGFQYAAKEKGNLLTITAEPSVVLPLSTTWTVPPTQENVFTKAVVYPDFYYRSTSMLSVALHAQYMTNKLLRTMPAGFFLQASLLESLSVKNGVNPPVVNAIGASRFSLQLGFQLFL